MNSEIFIEAGRLAESGKGSCLAVVTATKGSTPRKAGAMMLVRSDGSSIGTVGGGGAEAEARKEALKALQDGQPRLNKFTLDEDAEGIPTGSICGGKIEIFFMPMRPRNVLYLFGAGHVGKATAAIASQAGFRVEIFDNRPKLLTPERHPEAAALHRGNCLTQARELTLRPEDFVILMTHRHELDFELLKILLPKNPGYIGAIASRKKAALFRKDLAAAGHTSQQIEKVRMPIGLSISAETPEEIAIAIVAQLIEVKRSQNL